MQEFLRQDLHGNLALEAWIISPVDGCHTAASQLPLDAEPLDLQRRAGGGPGRVGTFGTGPC